MRRIRVKVAWGRGIPVYQQIFDEVCAALVRGKLAEGDALPAIRDLARDLGFNVNTVARAYRELAREAIIESRGTRGCFVKARRQYSRSERRRRIRPALRAYVSEALWVGLTTEEMARDVEEMFKELSPAIGSRSTSE